MDNEDNPYQSPEVPPLVDTSAKPKEGLGSLTQTARKKQLNSARGIFIAIGVLTIGANIFFWTQLRSEVRKELAKEVEKERRQAAAQGMVLDETIVKRLLQEAEDEAVKIGNVIHIGAIVLGVVFVGLGIFVHSAPVPITIIGLVLYILGTIGFGIIDPTSLAKGAIIKIFFIIGMVKAIQSAMAYEREKRMEERRRFAV